MKIAYVDEAGCTGALPSPTSAIQPVFVQAAVVVDQAELRGLTLDFLRLKARFFPSLGAGTGHFLDRVLGEVKGADLRRQRSTPRPDFEHLLAASRESAPGGRSRRARPWAS